MAEQLFGRDCEKVAGVAFGDVEQRPSRSIVPKGRASVVIDFDATDHVKTSSLEPEIKAASATEEGKDLQLTEGVRPKGLMWWRPSSLRRSTAANPAGEERAGERAG